MSKKISWKTETRRVEDLIPADYNPRSLDAKQRDDLLQSVQEFGRVVPLVVNIGKRKDILIGGHQRTTIYADLGIEEIEVRVPSRELSLEEEEKLNLRLNKNTGTWDLEKLGDMDMDLLIDVGFGDEELSSLWDDVDIIDDLPNPNGEKKTPPSPKVAPGEVWQLGNHRMMCGDATKEEDVRKLMGDDKAHMLYCDPPHEKDMKMFLEKTIDWMMGAMQKDFHVFYWTHENNIWLMQVLYHEFRITPQKVCMWIKETSTPKNNVAFASTYEPCVYGTFGKPYLNSSQKRFNEIFNKNIEPGNQVHDSLYDYFNLWAERTPEEKKTTHQKPLSVIERPLKRCTAPGHIVADMYAGAGSTLIACEHLGRKARVMEKDPINATIIIDRWEDLTGLKAKRV